MKKIYAKNRLQSYGWVNILLHWLMALLIIGQFILGSYMVDLDYYDPWYKAAPDLHRGLGVLLALLLIFRLGWRISNIHPEAIGKAWEKKIALWLHRLFYLLIASIIISGYLISTADGHAMSAFGYFQIPASLYGFENQEDIAGEIHAWLSNGLILLVVLHALAALKHHFIHRDPTLLRMLGRVSRNNVSPTTNTKE